MCLAHIKMSVMNESKIIIIPLTEKKGFVESYIYMHAACRGSIME